MEKVKTAQLLGYDAVTIANHHSGALGGEGPDAYFGDRVTVTSQFDGWGYVRLYDAATMQELDTSAIPVAMDPAFASGFGDLSVHEVATDPNAPSLAYLSYYSGGRQQLLGRGDDRQPGRRRRPCPRRRDAHPGQRSRLRAVDLPRPMIARR